MQIGIPRALGAYPYYPLWKTFLEELKIQTVTSPPTNRKILDLGVAACTDDACLPVKIFHGHALYLDGKADLILIPQVMSVQKKEYSCPLICALPEMVRFSLPLSTSTATLVMNAYHRKENLYREFEKFALMLGMARSAAKWAYVVAWEAYREHERLSKEGYHAGRMYNGRWEKLPRDRSPVIGFIAHPYLLYDDFTGKLPLSYLRDSGFSVLTPEMIPPEEIELHAGSLPKKMFWTAGKKLYASACAMAERSPAGIIYLSSFVCGVDSIISDLAERAVRRRGIPFMLLTIDEHTGEAGIRTRLEAFCEMLKRRRTDGRNVPAYGQYIHPAQGGFR